MTLASIGDAVIATDTEGRVTFLNAVAQELTGWTTEDAEGKPLEAVFAILNEKTRQPVENPVERVLREGVVVGLANHTVLIARDGTERPIDDSAAPIRDAAGKMIGVVLIFRDVTEQRRAEQHRNARLAVTHALSEAATVEDGAGGVLRAVCENLGWDVGFFWTVNEAGTALVCRQSWHRPDVPVDEFETASCSRTFEQGRGAAGPGVGERQAGLDTRHRPATRNFPRLAPAVELRPAQRLRLPRRRRRPDARRDRVLHQAHPGAGRRPAGDDGDRGRERRPVHRAEGRRGRTAAQRAGARRLLRECHGRPALGRAGRDHPAGQPGRTGHARLQPGGVRRSPHRRLPRRRGRDLRHPQAAEGRGEAGRVPGPPPVQGRVDQGRADRLQRAVAGRRVRPHPLLHQGRDRAEAGRGGPGAAGGHRRVVRRRHRQQDARRRHPVVERRGRAALRLHRRGGGRPADHPDHPAGAAGRGARRSWSGSAAASGSSTSRRSGWPRTAGGSTSR